MMTDALKPPMPAVCILNAAAGSNSAAKKRDRLAALFAQHNRNVRIVLTHSGDELTAHAKDAVRNNCKLVLAGGGDGTINTVANILVGTDTALGVLPLG